MTLPPYSVVIPAYNATEFIGETLASVMGQSHPPVEIIVVDDGSEDDLGAVTGAVEAPITLLRQDNSGPGSATTRGVAHVKTGFVATVDADDLWHRDKIARQFPALLNGDTDISFTRLQNFGPDMQTAGADEQQSGWSRSSMLLRLETFHKIGPIEDMPGYRGEMVDWLARARDLGLRMDVMEDPLTQRRIHKGSLAWGRSAEQDRGYMETVLRALRRRKENGG